MNSSTSNSKRYFVGFVVTFIVGVIAFLMGSEYIVRTIVAPKSDFDDLRARLHTSQAAYGAFADSRGANGLIASQDFENFSMAGDNLITILKKAKFFVNVGHVKGIVLQADPHHFASYRLNHEQASLRKDLFSRDTVWLQFMRPVYRQYLLEYWQAFIENSFSSKTQTTIPHTIKKLVDTPPAEITKAAAIRAGMQTPIGSVRQTRFAQAYAQTTHELQQAGVKLCMVSFPVSSAYREVAMAQPAYGRALAYYQALAKQVGGTYVDLSSSLEDGLFSDPDHLNEEGAKALTATVLKTCFGINP